MHTHPNTHRTYTNVYPTYTNRQTHLHIYTYKSKWMIYSCEHIWTYTDMVKKVLQFYVKEPIILTALLWLLVKSDELGRKISLTERYWKWNPSLATLREANISEHWSLWHSKLSLTFPRTFQQLQLPGDLLFHRYIRNMRAISVSPTWPQDPSPMVKTVSAQITCLCYLLVPTAFISHSQTLAQQVRAQFRVHLDCSKISLCKSALSSRLQAHRAVF